MKFEYGTINSDSIAAITKRNSVKSDPEQERITHIVSQAHELWMKEGSERKWIDNDTGHVLVIPATEYSEAISRLQKAARDLGVVVRVGKITGEPGTEIYLPFLVLDKPEPRPKKGAAALTDAHMQSIIDALEYEMKHTESQERASQLEYLIELITEIMGKGKTKSEGIHVERAEP